MHIQLVLAETYKDDLYTSVSCLRVINLKTLCTRRARWSGVKAGVKVRLEDDMADTADTFFFVIVENLP